MWSAKYNGEEKEKKENGGVSCWMTTRGSFEGFTPKSTMKPVQGKWMKPSGAELYQNIVSEMRKLRAEFVQVI